MTATELRGTSTADARAELLDVVRELVAGAEGVRLSADAGSAHDNAQDRALGKALDEAVARWSRDVPTPRDVVELVADVRRGGRLTRSREEVLERITVLAVARVAERQVAEALTDPLTGLATRARMEDEVQHLLALSLRAGTPLTAVILDVDGLKQVNDVHGHAAGDAALAAVGKAIREHARMTDRAFRWGGDEFVVLMPGTTEHDAHLVVERIQQSCPTPTTAGVATHTDGTSQGAVAAWLSEADADLYRRRTAQRAKASRPTRRFRTSQRAAGFALLGLAAVTATTGGWVAVASLGHSGSAARTAAPATQPLGSSGSGGVVIPTRPVVPAQRTATAPAVSAPVVARPTVHRVAKPPTSLPTPRVVVPVVPVAVPPVTPPVVTTPVVPAPASEQSEPPSVVGGLLATVHGVLRSLV
jgi:diguanylate cyclase (GGDEF)-like protein